MRVRINFDLLGVLGLWMAWFVIIFFLFLVGVGVGVGVVVFFSLSLLLLLFSLIYSFPSSPFSPLLFSLSNSQEILSKMNHQPGLFLFLPSVSLPLNCSLWNLSSIFPKLINF